MGLSVSIADPGLGRRRTKTRTKIVSVQFDQLDPTMEDTLEHFIHHDPAARTMSFFSRWSPTGRDWSHGASDLELLIPEFERALSGAEPGSETATMLGKLLAMARRALAENLVMVVNPD